MRLRLLILFFFFFVACKNNKDANAIIPPKEMQSIFWDMIRGDLLAREIKKDAALAKTESFANAKKVLVLHKIDADRFQKSVQYYKKHPELLNIMFDSLDAIQSRNNSLFLENKYKNMGREHTIPRNKLIP